MPSRWEQAVPPFLRCPLCGEGLAVSGQSLLCAQRHTFDVARAGYVNLLMGRKSLAPTVGDSRVMLRARQEFLERGYYAPLSDAVNATVRERVASAAPSAQSLMVVDFGCGTGYYQTRLQAALRDALPAARIWSVGVDVSRDAVSIAARTHPDAYFVVADLKRGLPFADSCVNVGLNIFAPRNASEFARVTRPGGLLLIVIPGDEHLADLRAALPILGVEANKRERITEQLAGAFQCESSRSLGFELRLTGPDAAALVAMTPSARRITEQDLEQLATAPRTVWARFELLQFRRSHG